MANNIVAHHNQCLLIVVIPASFFSSIYVHTQEFFTQPIPFYYSNENEKK